MIQTIILSLKTFSSFMLAFCMLCLRASRFFASAETQFGAEMARMLGSFNLQTLFESVFVISSVCLLLLPLVLVLVLLLVSTGAVALGVVRFCVRTFAEIAVLLAKGLLCSLHGLFRRIAACFFVLLIDISLIPYETVKDASKMQIQGRWDAGQLQMPVFGAAVHDATTLADCVASKRDRRVASCVSFIFILLMVLIGVVGALGGVSWLCFSAVGVLLIGEELRRSSAAANAAYSPGLDLLGTSRAFCLDPTGQLCERKNNVVDPISDWPRYPAWLPSEELLFDPVASIRDQWFIPRVVSSLAILLIMVCIVLLLEGLWLHLVAVGCFLVVEDTRRSSASTKAKTCSLKLDLLVPPSVKKSKLLRVNFMGNDNELFTYHFIEKREDMSEEEFRGRYDWRYVSQEFMANKRQEVEWEREFEVFASDDFFHWQSYVECLAFAPVYTDETFFLDEKGEKCHPAHWMTFCSELVPFLQSRGVIPPGFVSWGAYETYLRSYHVFYQTYIKWFDHHFCGVMVEPLTLLEEEEEEDAASANNECFDGIGNAPENAGDMIVAEKRELEDASNDQRELELEMMELEAVVTPWAPVKLRPSLKCPLPTPVKLVWTEDPVDMEWEFTPSILEPEATIDMERDPSHTFVRVSPKQKFEEDEEEDAISSNGQQILEDVDGASTSSTTHDVAIEENKKEEIEEESTFNNQPGNSLDPEFTDGCIVSRPHEQVEERLLWISYLPVIIEEGEEAVCNEEEEDLENAAAMNAEDEVGVAVEEEEENDKPEMVLLEDVTLPCGSRKVKAAGPCPRLRPYLHRKCKENVRYSR